VAIYEDQLARWARAPSETEEGKCQNAVTRITKAIRVKFGDRVSIFLQGSYRNRTNVRLDSDVDTVVRLNDIYFGDINAMSEADKERYRQIPNSEFTYSQFKRDVESVLKDTFGSNLVERHKRCIRVLKDSQWANADVLPCFVHKRFRSFGETSAEGIGFLTDDGQYVSSFPEQHYENGVSKNKTADGYKSAVRILKNVRNVLLDQNTISQKDMPSFFLECLVWNIPDIYFSEDTYRDATKSIISKIWNDMGDPKRANEYAEVSDLMWLFRGNSTRTHQQARDFIQRAWNFIGY